MEDQRTHTQGEFAASVTLVVVSVTRRPDNELSPRAQIEQSTNQGKLDFDSRRTEEDTEERLRDTTDLLALKWWRDSIQ